MVWMLLTVASAGFSVIVLALQIRGVIDEKGAALSMIGVVAALTIGVLGVVGTKLDRILALLEELRQKK